MLANIVLIGVKRFVCARGRTMPGRRTRDSLKELKQLPQRRKGAKKREFELRVFLCELCVFCDFA